MQRKILLVIALLAIGVVVLPQTVALFSGQHDWYNTMGGEQIPCPKCHADILQEIQNPGDVNRLHQAQTGGVAGATGCEACHVITAPKIEGLTQGPGGQFHAAASPACLDCHSGPFHGPGAPCIDCHGNNPVGIPRMDAREVMTGSEEVHKAFANQANTTVKLLKGANEACISCHTHVRVNITWSRATTIEFNTTEQVINGNRTWIVGNFNATGTNVTHTSG